MMHNTALTLSDARTILFVPGNRRDRFEKALDSGADAVVFDLEDAVSPDEKAQARQSIVAAWPDMPVSAVPRLVRINAPTHALGQADLRALSACDGLAGVMVPKVESAATLDAVRSALPGVPMLPLIESAAGYAAIADIARAEGVLRLVVGHIDFMADTGMQCSDDEAELAPLRFAVAMASRVHQLAPAVDGVTATMTDDARLRADTRRALRFGFGAKLCIHPRQIPVVHDIMTPSTEEIAWARRVVHADAAAGGAAVQLDGHMIDVPVVLQARRVLARVAPSRKS